MNAIIKNISLTLLAALCSTISYGQCDPILQTDSAEILFDGAVRKFVVQDNYLYAGGSFRAVGKFSGSFIEIDKNTGLPVNRRAWPKIGGPSNVIADGSGNYIVFGNFNKAGAQTRTNLAIINAAGVVTPFNVAIDSNVNAAVIYNNKLYIGGYFTKVNGVSRNRLAAIDLNTGAVTNWNPDVSNSGPLPARIECMIQSSGNIYVGGAFSNIGGAARKNIAMVDASNGTAGTWAPQAYFSTSPNYGYVSKMLKVNNRLYICGGFDFVGGGIHGDVAGIDLTTGLAISWSPNPNSVVLSLANKGDTLYLGGAFFQISGLPRKGFAAYSIASGSLLPIAINTNKLVSEQIYSILPVGNTLYLGGVFDTLNGQVRKNMGAFNRLTGATLPWTSHTNADVTSIIDDNGKLLVAGKFMSVGMKARSFAAAIDLDADTVAAWNPYLNNEVLSMNIRNKVLYIGGNFNEVNDSVRAFNVAIDLKTNKVLAWNPKADGPIKDIQFYKNSVYVGGEFKTINGQTRYGLAKMDTVCNIDPWIGITDKDARVNTMQLYKDTLYIGGNFNDLAGQPIRSFGAIDLTTGTPAAFNPTAHLANLLGTAGIDEINTFYLRRDTLYAGGYSNWLDTVTPAGASYQTLGMVASFNLNYTTSSLVEWDVFRYPNFQGKINDILVTLDNRLYVAGAYSYARGAQRGWEYRNGIAVFSLPIPKPPPPPGIVQPEPSPALGPDFDLYGNGINTICQAGNKLFLGGYLYNASIGYLNSAYYVLPSVALEADIATDTNGACSGIPLTVRAKSSITYGASYHWNVNGANISNPLPYYTSVPNNKDSISCVVTTPANGCFADMADTTEAIVFDITPTITPDVSITSVIEEESGKQVTVKAIVKDAATGYTIEWFNKGVSMGKTAVDTFNYTKGSGTDSIYAVITPRTDTCYVTDTSGLIVVNEKPVGIGNITGDARVMVYPNPFDTYVKVAGVERGDILILYDVTGRKISTGISASKEDYLLETGKFKTGVYVLKIADHIGALRKTILVQKK